MAMAGARPRGAEPRQKLPVYVRFRAPDRHAVTFMANELAARMFADIGISLKLKSCQPATESGRLPIVIDVISETGESSSPRTVGYSLRYEGSHISIFLDLIEKTDYPAYVLAHVMVHELAHILQGVSRHSNTWVMKARWNTKDYCEMRLRRVRFPYEDVGLICEGLAARRAKGGAQ